MIGLQHILNAMEMKDVELAALKLYYFTCWPKVVKAYGTFSRLNEQDAPERKLPYSTKQGLVPSVHITHTS